MGVLEQFRLDGRVALVTGAGRGIGLAIARALAEAGAAVAIQDIELAIAEAEAQRLRDSGARAAALGGDTTRLADVEGWPAQAQAALGGPVDVLVNNASIQASIPFTEWPVERVDEVLRANVTAPLRLCQLVLPAMRARRWGRILNVGSIQGTRGYVSMSPYSASKAALHNLTNSLARSEGEHNITVNTIAPGYFDTHRNRWQFEGQAPDTPKRLDHFPLKRSGLPGDCAGAALFLCSDASAYITGVLLPVDGGMFISG